MATYFVIYIFQATLFYGPMTSQACEQMVVGFNSETAAPGVDLGATAQCELRSGPPSGKQESAS